MSNAYESLYKSMKEQFTVVDQQSGAEFTVGDYMKMKANSKHAEPAENTSASLPVVRRTGTRDTAVAQIISYVNDKLTIKTPPAKDKTIRAFPFRASASAFLSAAIACAFVVCFTVIGAKVMNVVKPIEGEAVSFTEYAPEAEEEILPIYESC